MSKVKICGLKSFDDIDYVNIAKPDYVGFIFAESNRKVTSEKAVELKKRLNNNIKTVGVFVDEDICKIMNICNLNIIDYIQLHGHENDEYIERLKKLTNKKIIKAVDFSKSDVNLNYDVDYLLLDNGKGGTGKKFNWHNIENIPKPFFLAGGISENNLDEAIKIDSYCIDISSGVETDGKKDKEKIINIVRRIRNE